MFYEPSLDNANPPINWLKVCVTPRPIGWISSVDDQGIVNLAPYSYFNIVADEPPMVMFATTGKRKPNQEKDTLRNVEATGEFVINIATYALREAVNQTSAILPFGMSEVDFAHVEMTASQLVKPPRVRYSPIHLECIYIKTVSLPIEDQLTCNKVIFGRVIGIHINEGVIAEGKLDYSKLHLIARMGYDEYALIEQRFTMERPTIISEESCID